MSALNQNMWTEEQRKRFFGRWKDAVVSGEVRKLEEQNWYGSLGLYYDGDTPFLGCPICTYDDDGLIQEIGYHDIPLNKGEGKSVFRLNPLPSSKGF